MNRRSGGNLLPTQSRTVTLWVSLSPARCSPEIYSSERTTLSERCPSADKPDYGAGRKYSVKGDAPWNSFKDLIKYAKENPGMKVGIQGVYTGAWLLLARMNKSEGTNFVSAPFGGGPEIITALLGGHIPVGTPEYSRVRPLREADKLKALTILATKRPEFAPDIPTVVDLGYRLPERAFIALSGPKGMPDEIVRRLDEVDSNSRRGSCFPEEM